MNKLKKPLILMIISLLLILIGSVTASMVNSSSGDVDVSRIYFKTERGELSGLLYKPEGADESPRPTIIATHGYLNSAEMQDAQSIEMAKRGYVVLALDQYDHGHSTGTMEKPIPFFSFWPYAMYDAVQYMYDQDYVLKDADGNGIIAATGHSMGGFSTTHAVMLDEKDFQSSGIRKIFSSLTMGSDYMWVKSLGYTDEDINNSYGPRTSGKVAAEYDEFFFDAEAEATGKTVVKKNYVATPEGLGFLGGIESAIPGKVYDVNGGKRIVYQPNETHPWNHFSKESTGDAIKFYDMAFADYSDVVKIGDDSQSWMWKEWFSFIALIGFILLFIPLIQLITKLPFFNKVYTQSPELLPAPTTTGEKLVGIILLLIGILFPALFFSALYSGDESGMRLLRQVSLILTVVSAVIFISSYVKKYAMNVKWGSGILALLGIVQYVYLHEQARFLETTKWLGAPVPNPVAYWAINVAIVTLMVLVGYHFVSKRPAGARFGHYGLKTPIVSIVAALATAVVAVVIGYLVLFAVDAIWKVDFRIWTFAVKTFEDQHVVAMLKYAPLFFIYYFIVGLSVNINTAAERFNGWKGYALAIVHFIGGLVMYLAYQYGLLFITGTAGYPAESLSSIIVIGLIPALIIAAVFNRYFFRKTGNVYVGAFLNTLLLTMITIANTTLYTIF